MIAPLAMIGGVIAWALFEVLVHAIVRRVVRLLHIDGPHDRVLRWLEGKRFRPPADALTQKEILALGIVKSVDSTAITEDVKRRIVKELGYWGLLRREWDRDLSTPLKFDWKKFFVQSRSTLAEHIVPKINPLYDSANIACFVLLPFPRKR